MTKPIIVTFQYAEGHNPKPNTDDEIAMVEMPSKPTIGELIVLNIPKDETVNCEKRVFEVLRIISVFYLYPQEDEFTFMDYVAEVKKVN